MGRKARKQLHKQIMANSSHSTKCNLWGISVMPYRRMGESDKLGWGVIVDDIYESKKFCEFYSEDKNEAEQFAKLLEEKVEAEEIYWENYWNQVTFHNSIQFGSYYSGL